MTMHYRAATAAALIAVAAVAAIMGAQKAAPAAGKWTPLFNGKNLDGWEEPTAGKWSVENGEIVAHRDGPQDRAGGWLVTRKNYGDFILRLKFKPGAKFFNSGILIRDPGHARVGRPAMNGFEIQLANDEKDDENPSGSIYDVARAYDHPMNPQEWYSFEVRCVGDHIVAYMNGEKTAEAHSRRSYYGAVGMQIHGGTEPVDYRFKDIEISELPPAARPAQLMEEKMERAPGDVEALEVTPAAGWSTENGILRGASGEAAATRQVAGSFILDFSFRLSKGGQASIDLRAPGGYELRLADGHVENPTGSFVGVARAFELDPCLQKAYRPGQWNQARLYVSDDRVVSYLNRVHLAEGAGRSGTRGSILFRVPPGSSVEFRNLTIKRVAATK